MQLKNLSNLRLLMASLAFSLFALSAPKPVEAALMPTKLKCEYRSNPQGIDVKQPRLQWQVQAQERDQSQTGYQILVASSQEQLKADHGDLWDSGRISSDETTNIQYAGKTLQSGEQCFWKVKVWDGKGKVSDWSPPAVWSIGLLENKDWQGNWIGRETPEKTNDLDGAQWIWFPEGNPVASAPSGARYFRRVFELPINSLIRAATIEVTADNEFQLFVNGREVGGSNDWMKPGKFDIGPLLKAGKNVLAVEARNIDQSPAGMVGKLKVTFAAGNDVTLTTDGNWKTATAPEAGWNSMGFNDSKWLAGKILGAYGMEPWGNLAGSNLPARYLRREFTVKPKIARATAYICGLGLFELYINGRKIGDDVLAPALSQFSKRAFYRTFDITEQLRRGSNAVGVTLGNGRYWAPRPPQLGYPKLQLQMDIDYADGTKQHVVSDKAWKLTTAGPIRWNNEYDGEEYDARMEMPGWSMPGFNDTKWQSVQVVEPGPPVLSAQIGEPIKVMETIRPAKLTNPKPGIYVYDMGQNMGGWCRLKASGPPGTPVKLRYAETINPDGTLLTANLRTAKATDIYTLKGTGEETYEPHFTHHGFRYVEVSGFPGKPGINALEGKVVYDAVPKAGDFSTSNPLLNQLYHNIYWTTRNDYRSIPTDLPRDERQGWLGDRQEVSKGETYMFDVDLIYAQWLVAIRDAQREDGSVSDVCPAYWPLYNDGTVWASTYIIVPHMMYDQYGDIGILTQHYDSMKKWCDYMTKFLEKDIMPRNTYGDWCVPPKSPTEIHSSDPSAATAGPLLSTAIFYHDLRLMARSARLLGKAVDANNFEVLALRLKAAFNHEFYKPELGYYDNGTQTSCVLPLAFGMVPEENRAKVFGHLVKKITVDSNNHLATGLVGGHYLLRVLSDNGRTDLAYKLATQTTYPSWGYMASKGATTIWELWNGDTAAPDMNSANIVMLIGDLNIWFHEYLGGIRPDMGTPGFKKIIIKPEIVDGLDWVKENYDSIHGRISSTWNKSVGKLDLQITIPANTTATVYLPTTDAKSITESGRALTKIDGLKSTKIEADRVVLKIGSGNYRFKLNTP
ncbi:alpha-rhamnosidase [bacterium]|nr:MAG: alpha-rhamnosidase [bacterium]